MNSTDNPTVTTINKFLVENFLELNHKTWSKLNTKDTIKLHYTNIAQTMVQINSSRPLPKREKFANFIAYFQHAPHHLPIDFHSLTYWGWLEATITTQSPKNKNSCDNPRNPRYISGYFRTKGSSININFSCIENSNFFLSTYEKTKTLLSYEIGHDISSFTHFRIWDHVFRIWASFYPVALFFSYWIVDICSKPNLHNTFSDFLQVLR